MNILDSFLVPRIETSSESDIVHEYTTTESYMRIEALQPLGINLELFGDNMIEPHDYWVTMFLLGFLGVILIICIYAFCKFRFNQQREIGNPPPQNEDILLLAEIENRGNPNEIEQGDTESSSTSFSLNPQQNEETVSLPESSIGKHMPESSKNIEETSSEEANVSLSEHVAKKTTQLLERESSPTSPDIARKRHPSSEVSHHRPPSWM